MRGRWMALCLVGWVGSACGGDGSGPAGPLAGDWASSDPSVSVTMTLQHDGSVTGTGFITAPGGSATLGVSGTYGAPMVNLSFDPDQAFFPFTFAGQRVGADSLTGVFNGSGFDDYGIVFVRQP